MRQAWNPVIAAMTPAERQAHCDHVWRFAGSESQVGDGCSSPSRMVCLECDTWFVKNCGSARPTMCAHCAEIKRGDVAAIGRSGWSDRPTDRAVWLTLTAPGTDVLPFDEARCTHGPGVKCSGAVGCVVETIALAWWHTQLPGAWSHFVTEVRRSLNGWTGGPPSSWPIQVEFFKTYEPQRRHALHIHAMVRVTGVVTERRFRAACRRAARMNGFGPQIKAVAVDISNERSAARVAGYCAKYSTKSSDALPAVLRYDRVTGERLHGGLRAWSASRRWGDTMKSVQARRTTWWAVQRSSPALGSVRPSTDDPPPLDLYCNFYADDPTVRLSG